MNSNQPPTRLNALIRSCHLINGNLIKDWSDSQKNALIVDMTNVVNRTQHGSFDKRLVENLKKVLLVENESVNSGNIYKLRDAMVNKGLDFE